MEIMMTKLAVLATSLVVRLQLAREEGQTLVEYSLIIAVVSVLLVGALTGLRGSIENVFTEIENAF
jgi:Flp pilus assembly pilin Flp